MPTEWLKIMLEEVRRRRDDATRAREEDAKRQQEQPKDAVRPQAVK